MPTPTEFFMDGFHDQLKLFHESEDTSALAEKIATELAEHGLGFTFGKEAGTGHDSSTYIYGGFIDHLVESMDEGDEAREVVEKVAFEIIANGLEQEGREDLVKQAEETAEKVAEHPNREQILALFAEKMAAVQKEAIKEEAGEVLDMVGKERAMSGGAGALLGAGLGSVPGKKVTKITPRKGILGALRKPITQTKRVRNPKLMALLGLLGLGGGLAAPEIGKAVKGTAGAAGAKPGGSYPKKQLTFLPEKVK